MRRKKRIRVGRIRVVRYAAGSVAPATSPSNRNWDLNFNDLSKAWLGYGIDITLATADMFTAKRNWVVLDDETLSLHKYINFEIATSLSNKRRRMRRGGLMKDKFATEAKEDAHLSDEITSLSSFMDSLERINKSTTLWVRTDTNGNKVYWWTPELAQQKTIMISARRILTRAREKSTPQNGIHAALTEYKTQRRMFKNMILKEKQNK